LELGAAASPAIAPAALPGSGAAVPQEIGAPQGIPVPPFPPAPEDRRASGVAGTAERSFTALLLLLAAAVVFLALQGRLDRRDPKLDRRPPDAGGDFRRFR
jgi:hypothetical protein